MSVALCCLAILGIAGCGRYAADKPKPAGKTLVVGYEPYAPFLFEERWGAPVGLDRDLAAEVAKRNGWRLQLRRVKWNHAARALNLGEVDCLWNSVKLSPERASAFDCTAPYLESAEVAVATKASGIRSLEGFRGRRLVIERSTPTWKEFTSGALKRFGSSLRAVVPADDYQEMLQTVATGKADGLVTDYWVARRLVKENPALELIPQNLFGTQAIVAVRRGREKFRDQIQRTLSELAADGTLRALATRWLGSVQVPQGTVSPLVTTEQERRKKNILFIHSDSVYFLRGQQIFNGFSGFLREEGYSVNYDITAFNVSAQPKGVPAPADIERVRNLISRRRYDLIAVCNNSAAELFVGGTLRPQEGTPLVFLSWNGDFPDSSFDRLNATGIFTPATERDNIELARKLISESSHILVLTDSTPDGSAQQNSLYTKLPRSLKDRIESISGSRYSTDEMVRRAGHLSPDSVVILSSWSSLKDAAVQDAYAVLPRIRAATGALILGKYDAYLPLGADGGVLISNEKQGRQGGRLAARIFNGEQARDIPPETAPTYTALKYSALVAHAIPRREVPDGVDVIDVPVSPAVRWAWDSLPFLIAAALFALAFWLRQLKLKRAQFARMGALNYKLRNALAALEDASNLTSSASFRLQPETRQIMGSRMLPSLWPIKDGRALTHEEVVFKDDLEAFNLAIDRLLSGQEREGRIDYRSAYFGEMRHYRMLASVDRSMPGSVYLVGAVQDVTSITLNAVKMQKAQELCDNIISTIPVIFFVKDADDRFRYILANKALAAFLGLSEEKIIGRTDAEIAGLDQVKEALTAFDRQLMSIPEGKEFDEDVFDSRGVLHHCHTIKRPYTDSTGRRLLMGVSMDVTESYNLAKSEQITGEALRQIILDDSLERNLDAIAGQLQRVIGSDRVVYGRFEASIGHPVVYREFHHEGIGAIDQGSISDYDYFWETYRDSLFAHQVIMLDSVPRGPAKSLLAAPIFLGGGLWGVLVLSFLKPRAFTSTDENLARAMSNIISLALMRERQMLVARQINRERRIVVDNIGVPMALYTGEGKLLRLNTAARELLGGDEETLPDEARTDVFAAPGTLPEDSPLRRVLAGEPRASRPVKLRGRDFIVTAAAVTAENGSLCNVVASAQDVTDLNAALRRAQESDRAKSYFVASVSHEIRTPLNAIIGFSELLQGGGVPPDEQKEYLRSIAFSGNALLQIINDVLDLSKLEAGQMQIIPEPVDFRYAAAETLKVFAHRAAEQKDETRLEIGEMPVLLIDKLRLRQILFNLIGNAIKFTSGGTVTLRASFAAEAAGKRGTLTVAIADTGIGISPAGLKKLAQPFVQVSGIRSENAVTNGTGLGLAITKRLIKKMGGELVIESELGKGSVFRVVLPGIAVAAAGLAAPGAGPAAGGAEERIKNLEVLIVDDVPMNLKVITAMCRSIGVTRVRTADSGRQAIELLAGRTFDVILTDIWMPVLSGPQLAAEIRRDPRHRNSRIIAVTADSDANGNFDLSLFSGVLLKPVTVEKLRQTLAGK